MPFIQGKSIPHKAKELLPDGRWQHYCIRCNEPLTYPHTFTDAFDFKIKCDECRQKEPKVRYLTVSACE